jgi:hypothetical protein
LSTEPERGRVIYVTADSSQWLVIEYPFGLITPPTIELHRPLQGAVIFYYAQCYGLAIPAEAQQIADMPGPSPI